MSDSWLMGDVTDHCAAQLPISDKCMAVIRTLITSITDGPEVQLLMLGVLAYYWYGLIKKKTLADNSNTFSQTVLVDSATIFSGVMEQ